MPQERELERQSSQLKSRAPDTAGPSPGGSSASSMLEAPERPLISALIQRKADNGVSEGADTAIAAAASSSGMSLPATIQRKFEASLGTDLSAVKIHTGETSAHAAREVGAKAYTMGQDIHFGAGQFDPSSPQGEHLLAHEVAHTVQQRGGTPTRQNKLEVSSPHDAAEHEADHTADAMVSGGRAMVGGFSGLSRDVLREENHANTHDASTDDSRQAARKKIADAKTAADHAIDRSFTWLIDQWTKYIGRTAESPAVYWEPQGFRQLLAIGAGKGIGAAAGAVKALALPEAGFLLSEGIDMLVGKVTEAAKEQIAGGKALTPEQASSAGRDALVSKLTEKLKELSQSAADSKDKMEPLYDKKSELLARSSMPQSSVDELSAWAESEQKVSDAVRPSGDSLYGKMLANWVGNHAHDATSSTGVNSEDWKKACKALYGVENIPRSAFWAMQLRTDWVKMGLPTAQADQWLSAGTFMTSGEIWFDHADDPDALAKVMIPDQRSPKFQYVGEGGNFRLNCRFTVGGMSPDAIGAGYAYIASKNYTLEAVGMPGDNGGSTPISPGVIPSGPFGPV